MASGFVTVKHGVVNVDYIRHVYSVQKQDTNGKPYRGHLVETDDGLKHEVSGWVDIERFNNAILPSGPWALTLVSILWMGRRTIRRESIAL